MSEFDTDVKIPRYAASLDFDALWKEFPPADEYFKGPYQRPPEQIREIQNSVFSGRWSGPGRCRSIGSIGARKAWSRAISASVED